METQDGGDAKVEVAPRDIVYMQSAEAVNGDQPEVLHKLDLRYGYVFDLPTAGVFILTSGAKLVCKILRVSDTQYQCRIKSSTNL